LLLEVARFLARDVTIPEEGQTKSTLREGRHLEGALVVKVDLEPMLFRSYLLLSSSFWFFSRSVTSNVPLRE
jgi:hypothetical protein